MAKKKLNPIVYKNIFEDVESELEQKDSDIVNIEYNLPQLIYAFSLQKFKVCEWSRGTGKSTILGWQIKENVVNLPRSTGVMVASTYAQIKTRTFPSTIASLEMHGLYKDVHFFVGKRPPVSWDWPEPYEPPLDYSHCVIFWNGAVMLFVSQDGGAASGRGLNVDWVVGDEAALLDEAQFNTDVLLTNRGNLERIANYPDGSWAFFREKKQHHSVTLVSSTPITQKGMWILKYEELAVLHPDEYCFISANAETNRKNLGDDYFRVAEETMPKFLYDAEIMNIRVLKIQDGFYPLLSEDAHAYVAFDNNYYSKLTSDEVVNSLGDSDCFMDDPLILGVDFGSAINCMVVAQERADELLFIKNIYVKAPDIIDNLVDKFADYYVHHKNKLIYLHYDASGNNRVANSKLTYAEQFEALLHAKGWNVIMMTQFNTNVEHSIKYRLWQLVMKGSDERFPKWRINKSNCKELWISMSQAPAKSGYNDAIKKDKKSERNKGYDQAHATHFSDAGDFIVVGMFLNLMYTEALPQNQFR